KRVRRRWIACSTRARRSSAESWNEWTPTRCASSKRSCTPSSTPRNSCAANRVRASDGARGAGGSAPRRSCDERGPRRDPPLRDGWRSAQHRGPPLRDGGEVRRVAHRNLGELVAPLERDARVELGVPVYETRHEATAMAMAEGYARATGKVAICSTTAGPGLAHTFVPLWSASRRVPSPVVVLTGPHSRDDVDGRQALDHEGLVRMSSAQYLPLNSPDIAVERARAAMDLVRSRRRPVVFDIPLDVQDQDYPWDVETREHPQWLAPQPMAPDAQQVEAAAALLSNAHRPVIVAGGGAASIAARDELAALAEAAGALVATTTNARGLFHGDPFNAGVAGLFSRDAT